MDIDEINKQREQLWKEYKEGRITDAEFNSTLDILNEDELRCKSSPPPQPLTANEKNSVLKFYVEIMAVIIIVLFVIVISRGCEISALEEKYQDKEWEAEEAYGNGYNDGYDDAIDNGYEEGYGDGCENISDDDYDAIYDNGYEEGYYSGYEYGYDDGYEKGYQTAEEDYNTD